MTTFLYNQTMPSLEERISKIEQRNKNVEADKAWETSKARRLLIILFTYVAIGLYLSFIEVDKPWINAVVPTIGFTLSTMTMPFIKRWWVINIYKKI